MAIPKTIYQTFKTSRLPLVNRLFIWWLKRNNPGYTYEFYDDERIEAFLTSDFGPVVLSAYQKLAIGAARADLFRYCILYKKGGIYLDVDAYTLKRFDAIIRPDDSAVISPEGHPGLYVQWALIYEAGHPFLADTIERVLENIRHNKYPYDVHWTTGPSAYSQSIARCLENNIPARYRLIGPDYEGLIKPRLPLSKLLYSRGSQQHWKKAEKQGVLKS